MPKKNNDKPILFKLPPEIYKAAQKAVELPAGILLAFAAMRATGLGANIMSLGGIAIAVGELVDAVIVLIENAHVRLAAAPEEADGHPNRAKPGR